MKDIFNKTAAREKEKKSCGLKNHRCGRNEMTCKKKRGISFFPLPASLICLQWRHLSDLIFFFCVHMYHVLTPEISHILHCKSKYLARKMAFKKVDCLWLLQFAFKIRCAYKKSLVAAKSAFTPPNFGTHFNHHLMDAHWASDARAQQTSINHTARGPQCCRARTLVILVDYNARAFAQCVKSSNIPFTLY